MHRGQSGRVFSSVFLFVFVLFHSVCGYVTMYHVLISPAGMVGAQEGRMTDEDANNEQIPQG